MNAESKEPSYVPREHREAHTPEAIARRLAKGPEHSYLRDFIYGAIDGSITTFAVVAGAGGAGLSSSVVIILGFANVVADGFSMAVANYLGTKAEQEARQKARAEERKEIQLFPEGEREEIRQIFRRKGFEGEDLNRAVAVITSDVRRWVDTMLQEEYGLALHGPNPWRAAVATYVAFIGAGLLPLAPFLVNWFRADTIASPFSASAALTGFAFICIGAFKSRYVVKGWARSGLETLAIGSVAAVLAYGVGMLLRGLVR